MQISRYNFKLNEIVIELIMIWIVSLMSVVYWIVSDRGMTQRRLRTSGRGREQDSVFVCEKDRARG